MISWNNIVVKLPICLSLCPSVWLGVKLNYVSGQRADCAKAMWNCTHIHTGTHTHTHTALSLLTEGLGEWVMRKGPHAWKLTSAGQPAQHTHTRTHTHTKTSSWYTSENTCYNTNLQSLLHLIFLPFSTVFSLLWLSFLTCSATPLLSLFSG